ncbi:MAG TPA: 50S ribosomal protein L11 methyltransferase [Gemmatimonadaceae bacterium]|nr:50S ribosomal protein L11 methyltransferase [Gemmatimonadaceae bacterium]
MSYTMEEYARMLADPVRAPAYLAAVRESVREGMVVADVGAGPGVLGVYAATLGARRVFLVEPDASVNAARAFAHENGVADRVEVIRASSTDIELPERADVIVSDLRGVTPFHGHHLASAADMRARLLAPGGVCIPRRDRVFAALVDDDALYARSVDAWSGVPEPLSRESLTSLMANGWFRARATGAQLLSEPAPFVTLDYDRPAPPLQASWNFDATRDGTAHGLLLWFDTDLTDRVALSNAPSAPAALYGQAFFPFRPAFTMRRGDGLHVVLRTVLASDDYAWTWSARDDGGRAVRHSTLLSLPLDPETVALRSERCAPRRSLDGEILRVLLDAADGRATFGELAGLLHAQFADRFATSQAALDYVTKLDDLWSSGR